MFAHEHIAAARDIIECARIARLWRSLLSCKHECGRAVVSRNRGTPCKRGFDRVARPPRRQVRRARSVVSCSIGWCVGPSSPSPTESCVYTKTLRRRINADNRTALRAYSMKTRNVPRVRNEAAVQRDAVRDRGHAELAHTEVDVVAGRRRRRSVRTPSNGCRSSRSDRPSRRSARAASGRSHRGRPARTCASRARSASPARCARRSSRESSQPFRQRHRASAATARARAPGVSRRTHRMSPATALRATGPACRAVPLVVDCLRNLERA